MAKNNEEQAQDVTLGDYTVMQKATAFVTAYDPAPTEQEADEVWNEARVRAFFGAYVEKSHGDTLPLYLARLAESGFQMVVASTGELALMLRYRREPSDEVLAILAGDDGSTDEAQEVEQL